MRILDEKYEKVASGKASVFSDIFSQKCEGYILRNFLSQEVVEALKSIYSSYELSVHPSYKGFKALPRSFNAILTSGIQEYHQECLYLYEEMKSMDVLNHIQHRMQSISSDLQVVFTNLNSNNTFSKSWCSIRTLDKNSKVLPHCGRLFQQENLAFFNFLRASLQIEQQLAFLMILDKSESTISDLDIYDANWNDFSIKIDEDTLTSIAGNAVQLSHLDRQRIILNAGDVLIFDEGNLWHAVPEFLEGRERISFGGFITKHKYDESVQFWV